MTTPVSTLDTPAKHAAWHTRVRTLRACIAARGWFLIATDLAEVLALNMRLLPCLIRFGAGRLSMPAYDVEGTIEHTEKRGPEWYTRDVSTWPTQFDAEADRARCELTAHGAPTPHPSPCARCDAER